jgi:hypothetical protein
MLCRSNGIHLSMYLIIYRNNTWYFVQFLRTYSSYIITLYSIHVIYIAYTSFHTLINLIDIIENRIVVKTSKYILVTYNLIAPYFKLVSLRNLNKTRLPLGRYGMVCLHSHLQQFTWQFATYYEINLPRTYSEMNSQDFFRNVHPSTCNIMQHIHTCTKLRPMEVKS